MLRSADVTSNRAGKGGREVEEDFRRALGRLATDTDYRERATRSPELITESFQLSVRELVALRHVAILSGADVSEVDRVRAAAIERRATGELQLPPTEAIDIDISCCSCCCCCCGETAVVSLTS
jgi:hypothetical protein